MVQKSKRALTRDKIIGMQVIDSEGYIIGTVKELSLLIGEPDQALLIADVEGNEIEARWSEVAAAGDMILLKPKEEDKLSYRAVSSISHCPSCGTELEKGAVFCASCGSKITR